MLWCTVTDLRPHPLRVMTKHDALELDRSKRLLVFSAVQRVTAPEVKAVAQRMREVSLWAARGDRYLRNPG